MMLGNENGFPRLLVSLGKYIDDKNFSFDVINGGWEGQIKDGHLIVDHDNEDHGIIQILCKDQDRLRGNYNDVFNNFHDVNYVAPKEEPISYPADFDDDIPF